MSLQRPMAAPFVRPLPFARPVSFARPAPARWLAARAFGFLAAALLGLALPGAPASAAPSSGGLVVLGTPSATPKSAAANAGTELLLPRDSAARAIDLGVPDASERAMLQTTARPGVTTRVLPIGFPRRIPAESRPLRLDGLAWQVTADGTRVAHVRIVSEGASALRVAFTTAAADPAVVLRMVGSASNAAAMGPYTLDQIAKASAGGNRWWSPVLEGSTATLEIAVAAGASPGSATLELAGVSHLVAAGMELAPGVLAKATGPGASGSCERDWKCVTPQTAALTRAASAQVRITFVQADGESYLCSATLVNDSASSQTPYIITANHCLDSTATAATVNIYWFYDSIGCSSADNGHASQTPQAYTLQGGGTTMLARSLADDWALVRGNRAPPAGAFFSGWDATPIVDGEAVDLHHPAGDLTKYSVGRLQGYAPVEITDDNDDPAINSEELVIRWDATRGGVTEGGSSGSGLLTLQSAVDQYLLRGVLTGGLASCEQPTSPDVFSRLDLAFPKVRDYLAPGTAASNLGVVVEYYHAGLDHYFMTMDAGEVASLDSGAFAGWQRTGLRFLAYKTPVAGSSPVCRAYLEANGSSTHFYSAVAAECDLLGKAPAFKDWVVETRNAFYVKTPDASGNCALGTHPIWRFFHAAVTNHRFTDDVSMHDRMNADPAWAAEGFGADAVIMCSPDGA